MYNILCLPDSFFCFWWLNAHGNNTLIHFLWGKKFRSTLTRLDRFVASSTYFDAFELKRVEVRIVLTPRLKNQLCGCDIQCSFSGCWTKVISGYHVTAYYNNHSYLCEIQFFMKQHSWWKVKSVISCCSN